MQEELGDVREAHIAVGMIIRAVHEPPLRRGASQARAVATGAEPSHTRPPSAFIESHTHTRSAPRPPTSS